MSKLAPQRRAHIVEQVQLTGGVRVSELTQLFGVSDMTIRRDLDSLAKRGLIAKVYGGATRADPSTDEPTTNAGAQPTASADAKLPSTSTATPRPTTFEADCRSAMRPKTRNPSPATAAPTVSSMPAAASGSP